MKNPKTRFIVTTILALIMIFSVAYGFYQKGFVMTWDEFYSSPLFFNSMMSIVFSLNSFHFYKAMKKTYR